MAVKLSVRKNLEGFGRAPRKDVSSIEIRFSLGIRLKEGGHANARCVAVVCNSTV